MKITANIQNLKKPSKTVLFGQIVHTYWRYNRQFKHLRVVFIFLYLMLLITVTLPVVLSWDIGHQPSMYPGPEPVSPAVPRSSPPNQKVSASKPLRQMFLGRPLFLFHGDSRKEPVWWYCLQLSTGCGLSGKSFLDRC